MKQKAFYIFSLFAFIIAPLYAQITISGIVSNNNEPIPLVKVKLNNRTAYTDTNGFYRFINITNGTYELNFRLAGFEVQTFKIHTDSINIIQNIALLKNANLIEKVVVSGGLKQVSKSKSIVPVDVYSASYLKSNPVASLFESLQQINGVRPQNNCNVCNTGDIHINGLEGPYTMILIDGMPIVSGLSTVYGLNGIPQALIERIEIIKGPASTIYGSEAVGGVVNVITKNPVNAPLFVFNTFTNSWGELNFDLGLKLNLGKKVNGIVSANYFKYGNPIDQNGDGFTDLTLQDRISIFSKFTIKRKSNKLFAIAARYNYEDRWGGQMNWNHNFRGGDSIYGESIYTQRYELFGSYALNTKSDNKIQFSSNYHHQNSFYGDLSYIGTQNVNFIQFLHNSRIGKNTELLAGAALRHTFYDDNTPATADQINPNLSLPSITILPGVFSEIEHTLNANNMLLLGLRLDYNSIYGNIVTPRLNYKWNSSNNLNIFRWSAGNGYRVANVFTEDHAALSGAREVVFISSLQPETSWNTNVNFVKKLVLKNATILSLDAAAWFTYFTNKIIPDYETNTNQIIYDNLDGFSVSQGVSLNADVSFENGLNIVFGGTLMEVAQTEQGIRERQLFTENFSGVWKASYSFPKTKLSIDYTGNIYSPMRLPLLSSLDERSNTSPWFSIQNVKINKKLNKLELYFGVQNLLNYTPPANSIARAFDPFDRQVLTDANGTVIASSNNPQALTFDPTYVFTSNQGRRIYFGMTYELQ